MSNSFREQFFRARRLFLRLGMLLLGLLFARSGRGEDGGTSVPSLRDQLKNGLRARRPEDLAFIARVVAKVESGKLPLEMVLSTFEWARKRTRFEKYPFPFFERALRERAARLGVAL